MTNDDLVSKAKSRVREELRIGLEVLAHPRESGSRRLYLERGHASLFSFCLRELGYSEPQAQLRIDAMRAMRDTPEIESKVRAGELNVTAVVQVPRFLRKEKIRIGKSYSVADRQELLSKVSGQGVREVEKTLMAISPESVRPKERERVLSDEKTELRLVIPEDLRSQRKSLQAIYSHRLKDPNSYPEMR